MEPAGQARHRVPARAGPGPVFGMKGARPAAATRRWCRWRTSTCISTGDFPHRARKTCLAALIATNLPGQQLGFDVRRISWRPRGDVNDRALRQNRHRIGGAADGVRRDVSISWWRPR